MIKTINVEYTVINNLEKIKKFLNTLPKLFACDFETASKFTLKEKENFKQLYDSSCDKFERISLLQKIESNGLSHPSLSCITHLGIAYSEDTSTIILCDTEEIRQYIYNWLISVDSKQIWHNTLFDFKHILYHTSKVPKNYVDTKLLAKCLLNNANNLKAKVGLKGLMGWKYGDWGLKKDEEGEVFTLETMYDEKKLQYTATDPCATYSLYFDMMNEITKWKI